MSRTKAERTLVIDVILVVLGLWRKFNVRNDSYLFVSFGGWIEMIIYLPGYNLDSGIILVKCSCQILLKPCQIMELMETESECEFRTGIIIILWLAKNIHHKTQITYANGKYSHPISCRHSLFHDVVFLDCKDQGKSMCVELFVKL